MYRHLRMLSVLMFLSAIICAYASWDDVEDIIYTKNNDEYSQSRCRLDVHYSDSLAGVPVIVWFHGGGLTGGEKFIPEELKKSGYVIVAPNYRLLPDVSIDESIDDAAAAVAWTIDNISHYGGDNSKIFVSGHSAGGYLTSMIGLQKKWLGKYGADSDSLAGLIPFSGQVITHFAHRKSKGISELQPAVDEYAPLFHIRKDAPPYVIVTGDADLELFGRYEENLYMWRMMKLIGHPDVSIYKIDGYNHGDMAKPAFHILKREISRLLSM